jgi:hypothetical protein
MPMAKVFQFPPRSRPANRQTDGERVGERAKPSAFVLVAREANGAMTLFGPFETEEAAASFAELQPGPDEPDPDVEAGFWVTELVAGDVTDDQWDRDELLQRGWKVVGEDPDKFGGWAYNGLAKDFEGGA